MWEKLEKKLKNREILEKCFHLESLYDLKKMKIKENLGKCEKNVKNSEKGKSLENRRF